MLQVADRCASRLSGRIALISIVLGLKLTDDGCYADNFYN